MKTTAKKMSVFQLTTMVAANMLGAGIIMLPTNLAQVGTISVLSWLVTAVGALLLAYILLKRVCSLKLKEAWAAMQNTASVRLDILWRAMLTAYLSSLLI